VTINVNKSSHPNLIFTYGGSTTYDVGVSNDETWSSWLSNMLGPDFVVENHGVPGYTTVEHIVQTSFDFRTVKPACAIYYIGWNDLRNSNLTALKPDYSDFHLPSQRENLGIGQENSLLERRWGLLWVLRTLGREKPKPEGKISSAYDRRLSVIYRQNVALIGTIANSFHVKPIFIPQILNYEKLTRNSPYGWLPFVNDSDLKSLMALMNADLRATAAETNMVFIDDPLRIKWSNEDFIDEGHFSALGTRKFAAAIRDRVAAECK